MADRTPKPDEARDQGPLDEIIEEPGIGQYDITDDSAAPVKEQQPPPQTTFRSWAGLLVVTIAVLLLAVPILWALGAFLVSFGIFGSGIAAPGWNWLLAGLFILFAAAAGFLYYAFFARDLGDRPSIR